MEKENQAFLSKDHYSKDSIFWARSAICYYYSKRCENVVTFCIERAYSPLIMLKGDDNLAFFSLSPIRTQKLLPKC